MAKNSSRGRGVMLRSRAAGKHYWRDEVTADGGKVKLRRVVRRREGRAWREEAGLAR